MSRIHYIFICALCCLFSSVALAKGERYGAAVNYRQIDSIGYTQGDSGEFDTMNFGLVHTRPIDENNNRMRWWLGFNYLNSETDTPAGGVYQKVTSYELRVVPQFAIANWGKFTPLLGLGLSAAYSEYKNRWFVDNSGYKYGSQLENINQFEAGIVVSVGAAVKLGSDPEAYLQLVPQLSYVKPVYNDGLGGLEFTIALLF
ncbi:hypothetical protein L4C34_11750 [Vibrio profundum]|uniref:hypothetical protein n=1 Tax=Vibrio profundum TaxID=2910247 RepID=UPI003D09803E